MKKRGLLRKPIVLILSFMMMISISMPAFATTSPYGTSGAGANPFNPRGYSIMEDVNGDGTAENVWLQSNYNHHVLVGNTYSAGWSDTQTGQYYVTSGNKQMDAWVDKGQLTSGYNMPYIKTFTSDPNVDVRYDFVVSINDGPFVSIPYAVAAEKNLKDSNGNIDATQGLSAIGYATRSVIDPDGTGNQWVYPLNFTLNPGTKYTFAYLRGFAANNGMSLILAQDTTADGQTGYTGVLQGPTLTDAERAQWAAHNQDIYQFAKTLTPLGTGVNSGNTVYSVDFENFYSTLQTYADLTALNSALSQAAAFENSVTDNDYKLGNYRESSVDALKTLTDQINAKTDLKEELQSSVDDLTKQLTDALNYAEEPAILVKGISLNQYRADMNVGDTLTLNATLSPASADDSTVTWASSNNQVATVENGVVKAVAPGDATITAKTDDGGYTATCAVSVKSGTASATVTAPSSEQQESTISAENNGGSVTVLNGTVLPSGTSFVVSQIVPSASPSIFSTASSAIAANSATKGKALLNLFELSLQQGNVTIEPNGLVSVKIPVPENLRGRSDLQIVRINSDNSVTLMNATNDGTYFTFETNHFSMYGIVADQQIANPKTGDDTPASPLTLIIEYSAIVMALTTIILSIKKRFRIIRKAK